ncbi:OVARIAN TUMOR DOMAIN-containing deubiquitinating enzyme 3 isoform X2 [Gossypium arboreum]|uniref:OVARIAN TUMOR DOMAIN-containing deubiquitinating enzyme 3 isoform X2 n=1 Tax=Gossypium arboreum TaxID=29729 RepID=UPI0022F17734|nr:OVARIAN TUMOR DOMAIN-containing deubiquitinating enzyme 3 isoform X2 [Gossypium arboreum]
MANKLCNETILEQLRHGTAKFELVSSPVSSISIPSLSHSLSTTFPADNSHRFFARIGASLGGGSAATKKVEQYSIHKVTGDGRCLFRALVKGMAFNKGIALSPREERDDADELRMAVKEILCDSVKDRQQYEEALIAITVEESLKRYCQRIQRPDFWGGESELLHRKGGWGFIPIAEYGSEFRKGFGKGKPKKVVRLLYSGRNHYDLLV